MTKEEFDPIEKIYHYTKFCNAIKILESRTLLFHKIKDMNDINELYRPLFYNSYKDSVSNFESAEQLIYSHQQISFSVDKKERKGFDIPAMWGHYGDRGNGVCLIFDKNKLMANMPHECRCNVIDYTDDYNSSILINHQNIEKGSFSEQEYKELFFKKTKDWEYEQEYRVVIQSEKEELLDFGNALIGIIMHNAKDIKHFQRPFESSQYMTLKRYSENIFAYGFFFGERNLVDVNYNCIWNNQNGDLTLDV